jgi:choline kinase
VGHEARQIIAACKREADPSLRIRFVKNPRYREGSILSLACAFGAMRRDSIIMDADVYFPTPLLGKLASSRKPSVFLADTRAKSTGEEMMLMSRGGRLWAIAKQLDPSLKPVAEATGFFKLGKKHLPLFKSILRRLIRAGRTKAEYEEGYNELLKKVKIGLVPVGNTFWTEMDFEADRKKILQTLKR